MAHAHNVIVLDHPVVHSPLSELRDRRTEQREFARALDELTGFVAYEALRDVPLRSTRIDTPVATSVAASSLGEEHLIVPILRAGLGMLPRLAALLPGSAVAFAGVRRDEATLRAEVYLDGLPERIGDRHVVVCDPMLATGGSVASVVDLIRPRGATRISVLCVLASAPGIERFCGAHPDVRVVAAAVDGTLDDNGYIVPGLGDAGDRLFGGSTRVPAHEDGRGRDFQR